MYIGEVSKRTQLSIKAIRLYEEKGLILTPKRQGVYRVYSEDHIEVLNLISEAKNLGMTLAEIKTGIKYKNGKADWPEIKHFLEYIKLKFINERQEISAKITKIDSCIKSINAMA